MKKLLFIFFTCIASLPIFTFSQSDTESEYALLTQIPGLKSASTAGDFSQFINAIYNMSIGIGSVLAVFMIIFAGVRYSMSDSFGTKNDMKERIGYAIGGLVLLLGAYVFLTFINPDLVDFSNKNRNLLAIGYEGVVSPGVTDVAESGTDTGTPGNSGEDTNDSTYIPNPVSYPVVWTTNSSGAGGVSTGSGGVFYESQKDCMQAIDHTQDASACTRVTNPAAGLASNIPPLTSQMEVIPAGDSRLDQVIPYNPFRRYRNFASKGDGSVRMSKSVIAYDAYIQAQFKSRFDRTLRVVSAYRDNNYRNRGSKFNHPYGYSIDYGTKELSQEELVFLQNLILVTGAKRVGFGSVNNAGTHVQWDYGSGVLSGGSKIYWCYNGTDGPFKGRGSMPGFSFNPNGKNPCRY